MSVELLADLLESFGVTCERKRNGSIWYKANVKSSSDFREFQNVVYNYFWGYGNLNYGNIQYDFFDHAGCYTADDGTSILMFSPYHSESHWPGLIKPLWDLGYYVAMFDGRAFQSFNHIILVRKRKDGDEMFDIKSSNFFYCNDQLDHSRYAHRTI